MNYPNNCDDLIENAFYAADGNMIAVNDKVKQQFCGWLNDETECERTQGFAGVWIIDAQIRQTSNFPIDIATCAAPAELHSEDGKKIILPTVKKGNWAVVFPALDIGYYQLHIAVSDDCEPLKLLVIAAPKKFYAPPILNRDEKLTGLTIQLYALVSPTNWGIGDFGDLRALLESFRYQGIDFIGLNPMHALFTAQPNWNSPYSPSSRCHYNSIYLDMELVRSFTLNDKAKKWYQSQQIQRQLHALRSANTVNYAAVTELKQKALRMAYNFFLASQHPKIIKERQLFAKFKANGGDDLYGFALFEALDIFLNDDCAAANNDAAIGWLRWPNQYRQRDGEAVKMFEKNNEQRILFQMWLQWLCAEQLQNIQQLCQQLGMRLGIYGDLAVGVCRGGADTWLHARDYCLEAAIGAPPDELALQGQNWQLPPFHPQRLRRNGYKAFIKMLRTNMKHFGMLRLDHVMALDRLWWIGADGAAAYVRYPLREMMAIVAVESHRHQCLLIGEDLGIVSDRMRRALQQYDVYSYSVLYFSREDGHFLAPEKYRKQSLAVVSTHDVAPFCGWWNGCDLAEMQQAGLFDNPDKLQRALTQRDSERNQLLTALYRADVVSELNDDEIAKLNIAVHNFIAKSSALLFAIGLENLLAMETSFNLPGINGTYPNWSRKFTIEVSQISEYKNVRDLMSQIAIKRRAKKEYLSLDEDIKKLNEDIEKQHLNLKAQQNIIAQINSSAKENNRQKDILNTQLLQQEFHENDKCKTPPILQTPAICNSDAENNEINAKINNEIANEINAEINQKIIDEELIAGIAKDKISALVNANCDDPFSILGIHQDGEYFWLRVYMPTAESIEVCDARSLRIFAKLSKVDDSGLFAVRLQGDVCNFHYRLCVLKNSRQLILKDPYCFPSLFADIDRWLISEGTHYRPYEVLGAHATTIGDCHGMVFRLWSPNARRVSLIGNFNNWDGRCHPMRRHHESGIWEIFMPDMDNGELYKFELLDNNGQLRFKADPYAFSAQFRPDTASVTAALPTPYQFPKERAAANSYDAAISIYEVHLGSWRRRLENYYWLSYEEHAQQLIDYAREMNFTHIELLPLSEYPFDGSWGYQPTGLYAPTQRFGTPQGLRQLIKRAHDNGIGVILDWVVGHFPIDEHGLVRFDGSALYEHQDPREGYHQDWNTLIYNFGRREVCNYLSGNALYWLECFGFDGLRVDAVASMIYRDYSRQEGQWIANEYGGRENIQAIDFLKRTNQLVAAQTNNRLMIAEESTSFQGVTHPVANGGMQFDYKWNMGWMNDSLRYMRLDPVHRKHHHNLMTFGMIYNYQERFLLALSHDEVVHGKGSLLAQMPGDQWQKFANLRAYYGYMWGHPGKKLLFMGCEFAQQREWQYQESLDWFLLENNEHRGMQHWVRDLNALYRKTPALYQCDNDPRGFEWLVVDDFNNSVFIFERRDMLGNCIIVISNFTPVVRYDYSFGINRAGGYREVLNSDRSHYYGSNVGNDGIIYSAAIGKHGKAQSLTLTLPPLSTLFLQYHCP